MPAEQLMGWNKIQRRWFKRYRGKLYFVSPRQLNTEATKEASRQAANRWWGAKQKEIDEELGKAKRHPPNVVDAYQMAIANHRGYARWHRRHDGSIEEAEQSESVADWLEAALQTDDPPYPLTREQLDPLTKHLKNHADWAVWVDRMRQQRIEEKAEQAVPAENTIRAHVDEYLAAVKIQAQAKGKPGKHADAKYRLAMFRKWVAPTAPIETLNEATWERFNLYLAQQVADGNLSPATVQGFQVATRAFVQNRARRRFIEFPLNLNDRALSVHVPLPTIRVFSVDDIQQLLAAATERTQLYLLLALNCGMYPSDIAQLQQDEVDWKVGRIARKRTKTRNRSKHVPKVDYLLWQKTLELLKKHRSTHPELVLLNRKEEPLWVEHEVDGKFNRKSNLRSAWVELMRKVEWKKQDNKPPLKSLRKTAASMLEHHAEYGRYAEYFLGEAPHSIATRHYIEPSRQQFDAAIKWLGEQFGIESPPPLPTPDKSPSRPEPEPPPTSRPNAALLLQCSNATLSLKDKLERL